MRNRPRVPIEEPRPSTEATSVWETVFMNTSDEDVFTASRFARLAAGQAYKVKVSGSGCAFVVVAWKFRD